MDFQQNMEFQQNMHLNVEQNMQNRHHHHHTGPSQTVPAIRKSHFTVTVIYIFLAIVSLVVVLSVGIGVPLMLNRAETLDDQYLNVEKGNVGTFLRDKVLGFSKNVLTFVGTFFGGDIEQDSEVSPTAS